MKEKKGDNRSRIQIWAAALKIEYMWRFLAKRKGLVLLTEYPKSGGSWVGQMLSNYTGLPFPRNQSPKIEASILHGHREYHSSFDNVVCVVRDGRDIMVSAYYHKLFPNDKNNHAHVQRNRTRMTFDDYENIEKNMPSFIEYMFTQKGNLVHNAHWAKFVRGWHDKNIPFVRYENLLTNPIDELKSVVEVITGEKVDLVKLQESVDKYSFKNLTNRKAGDEDIGSFIRKGIAGDWKNVFTKDAKLKFNEYAGAELILLGYEKDDSWVQ